MNKSYSNKALPAGTVLREWRLEEVLGVGGFGIVYKGRGIYFDELVAIKEYFPSAISERAAGDTVVPIDSNAEEVHALGLKKFVEEAKLLWNLSTPTRHPNIVSVRSLFEIHGTAYMVMDFEDGVALSKLLKEGRRFNEASLLALIRPIAEGLERAHRVGVLHRDIKPPNILVNEDGRPVLIDFGSARFESGEATSTTVTFHTPPYAAIEQYVKSYEQGPWTDIYALGVVLYECITGTKPPEVLDRMHAGLGTALADGDWPGYSQRFLRAVDAAMIVRPGDRPQSVSEWLELFDNDPAEAGTPADAEPDDDATRIYIAPASPEAIVPVAPPPPGFKGAAKVETAVPDDASQVKFKRAGQDTGHSRKQPTVADTAPTGATEPATLLSTEPAVAKPDAAPKGSKRPLALVALAAIGAVAAGGWYLTRQGGAPAEPDEQQVAAPVPDAIASAIPVEPVAVDDLAAALQGLAATARNAGVSASHIGILTSAATQLAAQQESNKALGNEAEKTAKANEMSAQAITAAATFASTLAGEGSGRAQRAAREARWADPANLSAARAEVPDRQRAAASLRASLARLKAAAGQARSAQQPAVAIAAAREAIAANQAVAAAVARVARLNSMASPTTSASAAIETPSATPTPTASVPTPTKAASEPGTGKVSSSKQRQFNSAVSSARSLADSVIKKSRAAQQSGNAETKRLMDANIRSAQGYVDYLNTLTNSMRGVRSDSEADRLTAQAEQTRRFLEVLQQRANAAR